MPKFYLLMNLFLTIIISGCNTNDNDTPQNNLPTNSVSVKMGGIFPFTGSLSDRGIPRHQAAQLAIQHLAQAGYQVDWTVADSKTDNTAGVEAARELVFNGNVQVLIGAASSSVTKAIAENIAIPNLIPQISYASTAPQLSTLENNQSQDVLFRTVPSDTLQGPILAKLAYQDTSYRRASILYVDNIYGQSLSQVFTESFEALGGKVVARVPHQEGTNSDVTFQTDYLYELQQTLPEESEVLVVMSYPQQAKFYIKQAIENDFFDQFLFVDGSRSQEIIDFVGAQSLEGMCGTAPGLENTTESWNLFNESYRQQYGAEDASVSFIANTYDAVIVAGLAAYAAQSNGEAMTSLTIRDYLRRVNDPPGTRVIPGPEGLERAIKMLNSGFTINYEGASGNVNFNANGDVITPIEIWCYEGGTIVHEGLEQPILNEE